MIKVGKDLSVTLLLLPVYV